MYAGYFGHEFTFSGVRKLLPDGVYCGTPGAIYVGKTDSVFAVRSILKKRTRMASTVSVPAGTLCAFVYRPYDSGKLIIAFDGDLTKCSACRKTKTNPLGLCRECQKTAIGLRAIQMYKEGRKLK